MSTISINSFFQKVKLSSNSIMRVSGLYGSSDAYVICRLLHQGFFILAVTETDDEAEDVVRNVEVLSALDKSSKTHKGSLFLSDDSESRISAVGRLSTQPEKIPYIICSKDSFTMPTVSPAFIKDHSVNLVLGETLLRRKLIDLLEEGGYERDHFVEEPGQYAVRGEVIDVWVPGEGNPYRIVYPSESVESIRVFDVGTQRSHAFLDNIFLFPAKEMTEGNLLACIESFSPYPLVLFGKEENLNAKKRLPGWHTMLHDRLGKSECSFSFQSIPDFQKNIELFCRSLREWHKKDFQTIIYSRNTGETERLQELLYEHGRDIEEYPQHRIGALTRGFVSNEEKLVCVANGDIFGRYHKTYRLPRWTGGRILHSLGDITRGDCVVHEKYGIGRYRGLEEITALGHVSEYIKLEYKGNDYLYVPVDDFQKVQKYIGGEGHRPRLYSLDGVAWEHMKRKVKKAVMELAEELLKIHAARILQKGFMFSPLTHMEREFADSFMYPETPDQSRTISEVLSDMHQSRPMDRVVCGDVGYGKTEVAMRAAFKAVNDSCQVAVLVPTTILAEQHFQTFTERMADYPVTVAFISRFQNKSEQKKILKGLKEGTIDIIIGTHRLLQKDIVFKNLKLFIVDEEHRFGVKHKEWFKGQFTGIDILTLSATPIPRTLYMGLSGVRELSLIETPPEGRQPIQTYVGRYDESLVEKAIGAEMSRGGQVFYVHNRIETIHNCLENLKRLLPSITCAVVHGKMKPSVIEKTMWLFLHKKIDCLVSTSIIESGLDIPNVNTLIVENAHEMGLAQLYQLRGRVGREKKRAHCFLFYQVDTHLTFEAKKRMEALKEFTSLSSGFHLAMRDLEIRGAGNVLGAKQHGFMKDVGFDLYSRLLKQEIERQQAGTPHAGEPLAEIEGPKLDLKIHAYFPSTYIPGDAERIRLYRKALECSDEKDLQFLEQELCDRFGSMPLQVRNFFELLRLRQRAVKLKIQAVLEMKHSLEIHFRKDHRLSPDDIVGLANTYGNHIQFIDHPEKFSVRLDESVTKAESWLTWIKKFLSDMI